MKPAVLIVQAPGTNRDREAAEAFALAGGAPRVVTLGALVERPAQVADYGLVCLPGGFSFGDALGAGQQLGLALSYGLGEALREHVGRGRPVLGICNGFQALMRAGMFEPVRAGETATQGGGVIAPERSATLSRNARGRFECRWVRLVPAVGASSPWLDGVGPIECPVAHAEGRLVAAGATARALRGPQAAFRYEPADSEDGYPGNPNGSLDDLAGVTDATGLILGLMPHPEDHVYPFQHPGFHNRRVRGSGLPLFEAGVRLAR